MPSKKESDKAAGGVPIGKRIPDKGLASKPLRNVIDAKKRPPREHPNANR